jgi:hypothetical protein
VAALAIVATSCDATRNQPRFAPAAPTNTAILDATKGQVLRVADNALVIVAAGDSVAPAQIIETEALNGAAVLRLPDGTRVRLGPGSRLRLADTGRAHGNMWAFLETGSIRTEPPRTRTESLVIGTSHGPVRLDGTAELQAGL